MLIPERKWEWLSMTFLSIFWCLLLSLKTECWFSSSAVHRMETVESPGGVLHDPSWCQCSMTPLMLFPWDSRACCLCGNSYHSSSDSLPYTKGVGTLYPVLLHVSTENIRCTRSSSTTQQIWGQPKIYKNIPKTKISYDYLWY